MTRIGFLLVLAAALMPVPHLLSAPALTPTPEYWEIWQPAMLAMAAKNTYVNLRECPTITKCKVLLTIGPQAVEVSNSQQIIGWLRIRILADNQYIIGWVAESVATVTILRTIVPSPTPTATLTLTASATPTVTISASLPPPPVLRPALLDVKTALDLLSQAEKLEVQAAALRTLAMNVLTRMVNYDDETLG